MNTKLIDGIIYEEREIPGHGMSWVPNKKANLIVRINALGDCKLIAAGGVNSECKLQKFNNTFVILIKDHETWRVWERHDIGKGFAVFNSVEDLVNFMLCQRINLK